VGTRLGLKMTEECTTDPLPMIARSYGHEIDFMGTGRVRLEGDSTPYRGLFPSPPLFDRMPTYRTQGKRSLNFLSATLRETGVRRPRLGLTNPSS
jgi:hypothetical protein